MDCMIDFFLENQLDLDADLPSHPPTYECEHRWERVLIAQEPGYACSRCGAEKYEDRFDRQDFDAWNAGKTYRRSELPPQPQCKIQTTRGHQCIHSCQPGKDMCLRHLKLSRAFEVECHLCAAMIAPGERYEPKFETLWGEVIESSRLIHDFHRVKYVIEFDEPFCSFECCLAFTETFLMDAHP